MLATKAQIVVRISVLKADQLELMSTNPASQPPYRQQDQMPTQQNPHQPSTQQYYSPPY